ncbi:MAG: TIGR00730 family Rossman fold protein [Paludibacter sp.]|jgi:uncharacterized protein (TIGR00730 family)|nr:TIGR00730 family Rossman fold protein [Paludibacter sp.]
MNICVFCSASNNIDDKYKHSARQLGEWLGKNGHTLVFGGSTGGLMTEVSQGAAAQNGKIIGVIPQTIIAMNRQSPFCTTIYKVKTMSERKKKMKELSDIFVVLPGSYGTLDEMFDVVAAATVGEHRKALIIVNEFNFYDLLVQLTENMKQLQFIVFEHYKPIVVQNIDECIEMLKQN